ncbi:MAG: hypothetical protein H6830_06625 [Planctomycetes bacterium]|nr:hypothetical protein [Planctomycetota bacterium]MCB9910980.1 hypothetical protein [Planctomycetota bacterium]MCB9911553.1 hypothetical protein [Planctomycetota bacterium]HPF13581.1 hypothetical protein [Planctomycetota bacterium]
MFPLIVPYLVQTLLAVAAIPCPSAPTVPTVELSAMHYRPAAHLGERVRFYVQLDQEVAAWNPFSTRFGPESYRCFRVWGDDQRLWDEDAYFHPAGRLFVPDLGRYGEVMGRAERFQRFLVIGHVRQILLGEPWIEVERIVKTRFTVPEGTLLHATRGIELLDRGALRMAHDELTRAWVDTLPKAVREDLQALIKSCEPGAGLAVASSR